MSEKGCLFSSKFNTISSNKIETKNLFTEGHIVRDKTIHQDENGDINDDSNPNGSIKNIAGILNQNKNVLGMMPHPERAAENIHGCEDGKTIFESILN